MSNWVKRVLTVLLTAFLASGVVPVGNISSNAAFFITTPMVAAGGNHTIALRSDGTVWAWGSNQHGELGDGTDINRATPVKVQGLNNITAVAAGFDHTAVLRQDGTVWTWGRNSNGQLGDDSTTDRVTPVQVQGLSDITSIAAGAEHTIALKNNGTVWAWGRNGNGQLGDGIFSFNMTTPVQVQGLSNVKAIAAGYNHSIALKNDGTVWGWGHNGFGQLGDSDITTIQKTPVQVQDLSNVKAVAAGFFYTVVLTNDNIVMALGYNNESQLGDGSTIDRVTPIQVQGLSNITAIGACGDHTVALKSDGNVMAWGNNLYGKLGDGTTTSRSTPVQVKNLSSVKAISAGAAHTVALKSDGTVWAWGNNAQGQLGVDNSTDEYWTPVQVGGGFNVDVGGFDDTNAVVPVITAQPGDFSVNVGDTITLHVFAEVSKGTLSYQWYENAINSNSGGSPINGATSLYYNPTIKSPYDQYYYCVVTNTDNTAPGNKTAQITSRAAKVIVNPTIEYFRKDNQKKDVYGSVNLAHPMDWYFMNKLSTYYDTEIAEMAMAFSVSAYNQSYLEKSLISCGFHSNDMYFNYDSHDWFDYDTSYALAKKTTSDGKTLVAIIIKGTDWDQMSDFIIDFTLDTTSDGYHSGFNQAMENLYKKLTSFLGGIPTDGSTRFFMTGHSLGASVSNLLAYKLSSVGVPQSCVFSYNFATLDVAVQNTFRFWNPSGKYDNIFNICNHKDIAPYWPSNFANKYLRANLLSPSEWGKYGKTLWFDIGNVSGFSAHSSILYMQYLKQKLYPNMGLNNIDYEIGYGYGALLIGYDLCVEVSCPVDVEIIDNKGAVIARVINNRPEYLTPDLDGIMLFVNDDEKLVYLSKNSGYTIRLVATDDGTMNYTVYETDGLTGAISKTKAYNNVALQNGKKFTSKVGGSVTTPNVQLLVTNNAGTPIANVNTDGTESPITTPQPPPAKGIFGTNAKWYGAWWHYLLFFLCFGFIWMWF